MGDELHKMTIIIDDADYRAIHEAIAKHQALRINGEHILPDGEGDLSARILAEICRGWLEFLSLC